MLGLNSSTNGSVSASDPGSPRGRSTIHAGYPRRATATPQVSGFALTVILTIALGIGANTAIFTLVHAVLLKSLPVADPKTLYRIGDKDDCCVNGGFMNDDGDFDLFSYDLYLHLRDTTPEFEQLAAMQSGSNTLTVRRGSEPPRRFAVEFVSGNFFSTFGIGAFAGRTLSIRGRHAGRCSGGCDQLSSVAVGVRQRPVAGGFHHLHSRPASDRDWNRAAGIFRRPDSASSTGVLDSAGDGTADRRREPRFFT